MIAGSARGIRLAPVPENVRPTADRVRESVFNSLGQFFDGGAVLDLYAGTGSLGLEALSRGCERAVFVEKDRRTAEVIRRNLETTRFSGRAEVVVGSSAREARRLSAIGKEFNLIFCDPPYKIAHEELGDIISVITTLLADDGTVVLEADVSLEDLAPAVGLEAASRRYGGTFVTTVRKEKDWNTT
ncbi:MAG: 16S rRNA (guanine(966)-N(2))-methyltransferase RsmD [Rubrobacter sp.]